MADPARAQWERARGAFGLVVEAAPADAAAWKRLRLALRMSRADESWFRERVPGVVRRGARQDLEPLAERARAAGFAVRVVELQAP